MSTAPTHDVAVIGAGIAGASMAWRLAGVRKVLLLEREDHPGYHTTGRSAAMFMESYGPPAVRALTRASRAFYESPAAGFCSQPLLRARGALYVARPGDEAVMAREYETLAPACPGLVRLDAAEVMARVPCLRPERVVGGLLDSGAMDIDVNALHQACLSGMRRSGGELRTRAEVRAAHHDGHAWTLEFERGDPIRAVQVVNAAGAWADVVGALFGARTIGLVPHRRSAFTFAPPAGVDCSAWPVTSGVDEEWYFKPEAGVLLGSPANADPMTPHDVAPDEMDIAIGIDRIQQATTLQIRRPIRTWAGLRSFVHDGELVIGWDRQAPGFFWLAGQGGYGIQTAPGASALAAAILLEQGMPEGFAALGVAAQDVSPARLN